MQRIIIINESENYSHPLSEPTNDFYLLLCHIQVYEYNIFEYLNLKLIDPI